MFLNLFVDTRRKKKRYVTALRMETNKKKKTKSITIVNKMILFRDNNSCIFTLRLRVRITSS